MTVSTIWRSVSRAVTSSAATSSSPLTTRTLGSPLTIVLASARSFWLNVSRAASTTIRKRRNPASLGVNSERRPGWRRPARSTACVAGQLAVDEQPHRGRLGDGGGDVAGDVDGLAEARGRRRGEPLDEDLVAARRCPSGRVSTWMPRAAARAASVCPEPVVSLPSESSTIRFWASSGNRAPASRSAAPMSVALADRRGRDPVDLGEVGRQALDERVPAERDDARDVLVLLRRAATPAGRRAPPRARPCRRVREVDDEHDGEPVDRAARAGSPASATTRPRAGGRGPRARRAAGPPRGAVATTGGAR